MTDQTLVSEFQTLLNSLNQTIIGQPHLTQRMVMALLAEGHILVEGPPGLAKTKAIKVLADHIDGDFHRIQFTPDLLPADITGTDIYRPETGQFEFQHGPIFHNLILADEINRAPAKVQSALLEAMAEGQVSIGQHSRDLAKLFMVMATQNPIEQEGTYPLPEAQLDRFMMHINIDYPNAESERHILDLVEDEARQALSETNDSPSKVISQADIFKARQTLLNMHMADEVKDYIVALIAATRTPQAYEGTSGQTLARLISYGVSPRATLAVSRCARAHAWLKGKEFVSPEDVQAVIHDVLRHRLILSFEAEANDYTADDVIDQVLQLVPVI